MPSSAFTVNGSGNLKPASVSGARSGVSSFRTLVAERVVERRLRRAVHARRVVDEELRRFGDRHAVRRVAGVEQLEARAVEADAIEVRVVRILALLAAAGREVQHARLVVDAFDGGGDELALGDAVLQRAGRGVVEIEVAPAVALGPEDRARCRC